MKCLSFFGIKIQTRKLQPRAYEMMVSFIVNFMKKLSKYSIALFILCCGSAIAQTTSNTNNILKDAENKLVAKVDGESIFLDEILEMAKQLPREYQKLSLDTVFPSLLARAIDARLVRNAGIKKGFQTIQRLKNGSRKSKAKLFRKFFLEQQLIRKLPKKHFSNCIPKLNLKWLVRKK